jgi:hypothetical protein
MDPEQLSDNQMSRRNYLSRKLTESGLFLRTDSDLCWDYILYGDEATVSSVGKIVLHMTTARYLHEYCNFQAGYEIAQRTSAQNARMGKDPLRYQQWLDLVNSCVLSTSKTWMFPRIWPWLNNINPVMWNAMSLGEQMEYGINNQNFDYTRAQI